VCTGLKKTTFSAPLVGLLGKITISVSFSKSLLKTDRRLRGCHLKKALERTIFKIMAAKEKYQGSHEELNSLPFPDDARNFSLTKLTCNSYFSVHFSRLLLPYTDSFPSSFYYTCSE